MDINKRSSLRKTISLAAVVNFGATQSRRCHTCEMSTDGVFIEMDVAGLKPHTQIEIVLRLGDGAETITYRLPAEVLRLEKTGVAVRFQKYEDFIYTALVNTLYAKLH